LSVISCTDPHNPPPTAIDVVVMAQRGHMARPEGFAQRLDDVAMRRQSRQVFGGHHFHCAAIMACFRACFMAPFHGPP
jgi:hypothetical protein